MDEDSVVGIASIIIYDVNRQVSFSGGFKFLRCMFICRCCLYNQEAQSKLDPHVYVIL